MPCNQPTTRNLVALYIRRQLCFEPISELLIVEFLNLNVCSVVRILSKNLKSTEPRPRFTAAEGKDFKAQFEDVIVNDVSMPEIYHSI